MTFTPSSNSALNLASPQIWWPYQMGAQPLYTLAASVAQGSTTLNSTSETFGIRTVTSSLVGLGQRRAPRACASSAINGKPLVIRGGGWDPDLFLRYDPADTAKQIALMKSHGPEHHPAGGPLHARRLLPADGRRRDPGQRGYQCCDDWEKSGSAGTVYQNTAATQGAICRNHPSIFSFQWSDNAPILDPGDPGADRLRRR